MSTSDAQPAPERLGGGIGHLDLGPQDAVGIRSVEVALHEEVAHAGLRRGVEVDAAVEARQTPEILIFEVGAVAPAIGVDGQQVFAGPQIRGDVELGGHLRGLRITDLTAVDPHVHGRGARLEVEEDAPSGPAVGHDEAMAVGAYGVVVVGNIGSVLREDVVDVGVDGYAEAVGLPVAGHGDGAPCRIVERLLEEAGGTGVGRGRPAELPVAVEPHDVGRMLLAQREGLGLVGEREGGGTRRLLVHGENFGIFPFGHGDFGGRGLGSLRRHRTAEQQGECRQSVFHGFRSV